MIQITVRGLCPCVAADSKLTRFDPVHIHRCEIDGNKNGEALVMEYRLHARRIDAHGSLAVAKDAEVVLDTDLAGRRDAMNPVELLLAALAACMLKGIERVTPILHFQVKGAEVRLEAVRQDAPPKLTLIRYEIILDSQETEQRLDLLHRNVLKYGTISNTLSGAVPLEGTLRRASSGRG